MRFHYFDSLGSTNVEAQRSIYADGDVIVADFQTDGRGQRGNVWASKKGQNLMFSMVCEIPVPVYEQFYVSMLAAVAARDAVCQMGLECQIKWSNDLYVKGCKIGGILIEHHSMGEFLTKSIIGIGINVNQVEFDPSIPNPTSFLAHDIEIEPKMVLEAFCVAFEKLKEQKIDFLHSRFMDCLWRRSEWAPFFDVEKKEQFLAQISAVNPCTGEITLLDKNSLKRNYWFKEIEFILE